MKKTIFVLWFCFITIFLNGQDFYMYVDGQKRSFEVSATKMLIKSEPAGADMLSVPIQHK